MPYKSVVARLICDDFGITGHGRWLRSETHSSLVIDDDSGVFFFNAEGISGDALTYLTKVRGLSFKDAREYLKQFPEFKGTYVYNLDNSREDVITYPKLVDIFWEEGLTKRDYWYRRGLTDETINRYKLGYHDGWFVVPQYLDGTFKNFQCRQDTPVKKIKGWYKGMGTIPFNFDIMKLTNKIVLTEGPIDAIILNQYGIPAVSPCGSDNWMNEWYKYFIYQRNIYILFDNDSAGNFGSKRVAKCLGEYRCKIYNFWDFEGKGYDVVDYFVDGYDKDNLLNIIDNKSKYIFEL